MSPTPLTIMAVDDDAGDIELLRRYLDDQADYQITLVECPSMASSREALRQQQVDVIILDYLLGAETGLKLLQELRNTGYRQPIIMLTGKGDERIAARAMRSGADDYLVKEDLNSKTVTTTLGDVIERYRQDQQRERHEAELLRMARYDELTGLYNRRYLLDRMTEETLRSERYSSDLCILMLDVDRFKQINDNYGHLVGDKVLADIAGIIRQTIRATDIAGRYGGEEFCIVLPQTDTAGGRRVAERLRERVASHQFLPSIEGGIHVTCSIGLAPYHRYIVDLNDLLERADKALYSAKQTGRDRVVQAAVSF